MKIVAVRTRVERFPLTRPYTIAFRSVDAVENVIVEIETEDGRIGRGAGSPEPFVTGETDAACQAALAEENVSFLVGQDIRQRDLLTRQLGERMASTPAARAALDIALHDLFAQLLELPLVEVLGRAHETLPTSITIGIKPEAETLAEATEYLERGFRVLKVKLGRALEEDIEKMRTLRRHVGSDVILRVDPNQGYDAAQVQRFLEATKDVGIEFLEQPLPVDALAALRGLPDSVRRRVAADENLKTEADALELLESPRACGIFNIKLMKCGGISPARRIAALAETAGIELMWGCMDESIVSITAALHVALASPATRYLDLDGSLDLARDVVTGGFILEDGMLRTTDRPGLGVRGLPAAEG